MSGTSPKKPQLNSGKFPDPATIGGLRHVANNLWKLLQKERQRNGDLKREIIKLRAKLWEHED